MTKGSAALGYTGSIGFNGETVTIEHNWRGRLVGGKAPRTIHVADLERIDFKDSTRITNGNIRFAVPGETHEDPQMDKNSVTFTWKQRKDIVELRDEVNHRLRMRSPEATAVVTATAQAKATEAAHARRQTAAASYEKHKVSGGFYRTGMLSTPKDLAGATAVFESGADRTRPTLTRIGAGAIIAGPVGAIAGGLFKKNKSKCYVTIEFADGDAAIIEGPVKDESKMRKFAATVNLAAGS